MYELFLATGEKVRLDISTVDAIENVVGKEGVGNRKVLSVETDGQTMARATDTLGSRKNFLQQQHVDHVEGRLATLTYKMNTIGEQKVGV